MEKGTETKERILYCKDTRRNQPGNGIRISEVHDDPSAQEVLKVKLTKATMKKLNEFRSVFEKWEQENVEDDHLEMDDNDLIHLALTCGIDYYGGKNV